jgi:hypothetical protein
MASTVWYIGKGERIISSRDWADYEIVSVNTVWNASNGWSVPTASLTSDQLAILGTMRDQFYLDREGPRVWPSPERIQDYQDSAYIYYARVKQLYEQALEMGVGIGSQGQRGSRWFSGFGPPSTVTGSLAGDIYLDMDNGDVYTLS